MYRRNLVRTRTASLGTLGLGAALTGCGLTGPVTQVADSYQISQTITQVVIQNPSGDVEVTGTSAGSGVEVTESQKYRDSAPSTSHTVHGGVLTLTYSCASLASCSVDYSVRMPSGVAVQVDSSAGNITLSGLSGDIQLQDSAGDIQASGLASRQARFDDSAGNITASFSTAPGSVYAQDEAGNVRLTVPGAASQQYAVTASSDAGNTDIDVPQAAGASDVIQAHSDAGSVSVLAAG